MKISSLATAMVFMAYNTQAINLKQENQDEQSSDIVNVEVHSDVYVNEQYAGHNQYNATIDLSDNQDQEQENFDEPNDDAENQEESPEELVEDDDENQEERPEEPAETNNENQEDNSEEPADADVENQEDDSEEPAEADAENQEDDSEQPAEADAENQEDNSEEPADADAETQEDDSEEPAADADVENQEDDSEELADDEDETQEFEVPASFTQLQSVMYCEKDKEPLKFKNCYSSVDEADVELNWNLYNCQCKPGQGVMCMCETGGFTDYHETAYCTGNVLSRGKAFQCSYDESDIPADAAYGDDCWCTFDQVKQNEACYCDSFSE